MIEVELPENLRSQKNFCVCLELAEEEPIFESIKGNCMNERGYLQKIDEVIAQGSYTDTWDSLCEHPTPKMVWKGKIWDFIHWGVYSVPAFGNEWYPRNMYKKGSSENLHHVKNTVRWIEIWI